MRKPENINAYIADFPPKVRAILKKVRATVRKAAPKAEEVISYGIPAFKQGGIIAYFAAFKHHIGFFPPTRDPKLKVAAAAYAGPKGNLKFLFDAPIPYGLIAKLVKFRVAENLKKVDTKAKKRN